MNLEKASLHIIRDDRRISCGQLDLPAICSSWFDLPPGKSSADFHLIYLISNDMNISCRSSLDCLRRERGWRMEGPRGSAARGGGCLPCCLDDLSSASHSRRVLTTPTTTNRQKGAEWTPAEVDASKRIALARLPLLEPQQDHPLLAAALPCNLQMLRHHRRRRRGHESRHPRDVQR